MLLTDCYPLKLSGTANRTSEENKTVVASKAVAGVKFGSTSVARTSCFVLPEEQLGLHKKCLQTTTQRKFSKMKNFASMFCHPDEDCIYMNNAFKLQQNAKWYCSLNVFHN